jgi:hypothetical protein
MQRIDAGCVWVGVRVSEWSRIRGKEGIGCCVVDMRLDYRLVAVVGFSTSCPTLALSKPNTQHNTTQNHSKRSMEDNDDKQAVVVEALRQQGNTLYKQGECRSLL